MGRCDLNLDIPVVLIDITPHTKFQVATIMETLKPISYKNFNLAKLAQVKAWASVYFGHISSILLLYS